MNGAVLAAAALLLGAPALALDRDLLSAPDPDEASWRGTSLSLGAGRAVCARASFSPSSAAGRAFVLDAAGPADDEGVRLAAAVVLRRGGPSGRAASSARRAGAPAVALGQGRWDPAGPALLLDETCFAPASVVSGFTVRAAESAGERAIREGDALCVDPASGRVSLPPPAEAEDRVAAAEAARAYDGLRDAAALERWLEAAPGPGRAAALLEELVPRAALGEAPADDLARLRRAAEAQAGAAGRERLRRVEARAWSAAARLSARRAADCAADAAAASGAAAARLADEARAGGEGASATARVLARPAAGLPEAWAACRAAAEKRARARGASEPSLAEAAKVAGADAPPGADLPEDAWRRFTEENGLSEWLARTLEDASLGLRLKSARVRERVLAGRVPPDLTRAAAGLKPPFLVAGEDAVLRAASAEELPLRIKEAWAAGWGPGPLGARQRAGRGGVFAGRLRVESVPAAEVSGVLYSRDPGTGRRERLVIEAAAAPLDRLLSGEAAPQTRVLDRASGRELLSPAGPDAGLDAARLTRLARLARGLDAWKGAGVEAAFSFSGGRLLVHHARALEPPRPVRPVEDPFAARVEAQALPVRSVR